MFHNVAERRVREGVDVGLSQASAVQVSCGHVLMRSRMHACTHMRAVYAPGRRCRSRHCHVACCPSTHATACVPHQSQPGPGHQLQPGDNVVGVNRHTCMQLSGARCSNVVACPPQAELSTCRPALEAKWQPVLPQHPVAWCSRFAVCPPKPPSARAQRLQSRPCAALGNQKVLEREAFFFAPSPLELRGWAREEAPRSGDFLEIALCFREKSRPSGRATERAPLGRAARATVPDSARPVSRTFTPGSNKKNKLPLRVTPSVLRAATILTALSVRLRARDACGCCTGPVSYFFL